MPEESQLTNNSSLSIRATGPTRGGQHLTISDRTIEKLRFLLLKAGLPTGTITFTIRKYSDKSVVATKAWGDAGDLTTSAVWREVTFDTPVYVNEESLILMEFSGGDASNKVNIRAQNSDVKGGENYIQYEGSWGDIGSYDTAYVYTYAEPPVVAGGGGMDAAVAVADGQI